MAIEVILILVYIASAGLMLRPKDTCIRDPQFPGVCFPVGDNVKSNGNYDDQPITEWNVAIVFSFIEM